MLGSLMHESYITTVRFNNKTFRENRVWRETVANAPAAIYATPKMMTPRVPLHALVYVIEMNNETNRIEGIGLMHNTLSSKHYRIHENDNYNRYLYMGTARIDRTYDIIDPDDQTVFEHLDTLLFKGYRHSKRPHGITRIPQWIMDGVSSRQFSLNAYFARLMLQHSNRSSSSNNATDPATTITTDPATSNQQQSMKT